MKTLYLIRHAKSSWDDPELADFDRPLNERGKKDAPKMAKRLKEREIMPDMMISSPARRAIKTCRAFAKVLGFNPDTIKEDSALYHADEDSLLATVQKINGKQNHVMIFGHNPGLTEFANRLTNENINNVPTSGVVAIELKIENWRDAKEGIGSVLFFDFPKKNLPKKD